MLLRFFSRAILLVALSVSAFGTTYIFSPTGNDANTCADTAHQCQTPQHATAIATGCDVLQFRGGLYSLPALQNGVPWTFTSANSGSSGCHITYTKYPGEVPIFTGSNSGTALNGLFVQDVSINCGSNCQAWYVDLDADPGHSPHYVNFEQLFYGSPLLRRPRPTSTHLNGNPNSNDPQICFAPANVGTGGCTNNQTCANVAVGCPAAGVDGNNCAAISTPCSGSTPYMAFNKMILKTAGDVSCSWRGIDRGDVELAGFEIWSMNRMRIDHCATENGKNLVYFKGPASATNGLYGFIPGHNYQIENAFELAKAGDWYLDRCNASTSPPCVPGSGNIGLTWRLYIFKNTATGEDPNADQIIFPQMNPATPSLLVATGLQYVDFSSLTFEADNWFPGPNGLPDFEGSPLIPAAVSFQDSKFISWAGNQIFHTQGAGFEVVGASGGDGVDVSNEFFSHLTTDNSWPTGTPFLIQNSTFWDTGWAGIRVGKTACGTPGALPSCMVETDANIPQYIIGVDNAIDHTGRIQYTGEASSLWTGMQHHVLFTHNNIFGGYCGAVNWGQDLNRGRLGGNTAGFNHHTELSSNVLQNERVGSALIALCSDYGAVHISTNLSSLCPETVNDPGTTDRTRFCTWIEYNVIKNFVSNFNDTAHQGAMGIYNEQGTSYAWEKFNVVARVGHSGLFNHVPSQPGGPNPNAYFLPQYNLIENNIFAAIGAQGQVMNPGVLKRAGDNPHTFTFRKNVILFNSAVGARPQVVGSHWGCFANDGVTPAPCTSRWLEEFNLWYDIGHAPLDFVDCISGTQCPGPVNHFSAMPWAGEDAGSKNFDPGFLNIGYPTDNFTPTADLSSIGFQLWDYTLAGRRTTSPAIGAAAHMYPLRTVDAVVDFLPNYAPLGFTLYGGSTSPGNFKLGGTNPAPIPPATGNNKYCLTGDVPNFGGIGDGALHGPGQSVPAQYPISCYYTPVSATPSPGTIRIVTDKTSWDAAWAAAACGDIIQITEGSVVAGTVMAGLSIPTKTCDATHYITVRTSGYASLPPEGTRLTPCSAGIASLLGRPEYSCPSPVNHMAKLIAAPLVNAITVTVAANTSYLRFIGIEFARADGGGGTISLLPTFGPLVSTSAGGIHHIIFDRVWMHGNETDETARALSLAHTHHIAVLDSYFNNFWLLSTIGQAGTDAQAINGGSNPTAGESDTTYKYVNNFLEAAGQSVFWGGGAAVIVPSDMEVRSNHMFKPQKWNPSSPEWDGGHGTTPFPSPLQPIIAKNNFELKNGSRLFAEGNILEGSWAGFSQKGNSLTLTPKNQSGTLCPLCSVTNIIFRYNKITTVAQPFQITNLNDGVGAGAPAFAGNTYSIHDNLADNLRYITCNNCDTASTVQDHGLSSNPLSFVLHDVNFRHNTMVYATPQVGTLGAALGLSGALAGSGTQEFNQTFSDNVFTKGTSGVTNSIGGGDSTNCAFGQSTPLGMLTACWNPMTFGGNAIINNGTTAWPGTNCTSETSFSSIFVNYNNGLGGDYHLKGTSLCKGTATDLTDPGANIDLVNLNTIGVHVFSTNLTAATLNNSSGCTAVSTPHSGCTGAFTQLNDPNVGAQTPIVTRTPAHISPLSVHDLMYVGWTGRFVADYQPWFGCGSHLNVGYNENTAATVAYQIQKMIAEGYDSISIDYYGTHASQSCLKVTVDAIAAYLLANAPKSRSGKVFTLILMLDKGALQPYCPMGATDQTTCLIINMNLQLDTIQSSYASKVYYETDAAGHSLVQTFIDEAAWSGSNWVTIMTAVSAHVKAYSKPFDLLKWGSNFGEAGYDGVYAWVKPPNWSAGNQFCWDDQLGGTLSQCADDGVGTGTSYLNGFYTDAKAHASSIAMGLIFRGFDDNNASWGTNRVIAEQCGNVWINSIAKAVSNGYGTSLQIPYMHVATYNDHEEGTAAENGTDTCYSISGAMGGDVLTRTFTPSDATYANLQTIAYWRVLWDDGTGTLREAISNLPAATTTVNLANLVPTGTHNLYLEMVSKAGLRTAMSSAVSYTH